MKKQQRTSKPKALPAATLDAMHDNGVDLSSRMDLTKATRPGRAVQRVNVDFPVDLLRDIDQEARRLGVIRQAFIKVSTRARSVACLIGLVDGDIVGLHPHDLAILQRRHGATEGLVQTPRVAGGLAQRLVDGSPVLEQFVHRGLAHDSYSPAACRQMAGSRTRVGR